MSAPRSAPDEPGARLPERALPTLRVPGALGPETERISLLDGGDQAYPRMLDAIGLARSSIHLEVYAFSPTGVGARFAQALAAAAGRGVAVEVHIDGWGSARDGAAIVAALRASGCRARIHNRLRALLVGRLGRNHRKVLLVDEQVAFVGGINIGDEYVDNTLRVGWADLALEIRGPACARLARAIRRQPPLPAKEGAQIELCGLGGGWRLRRRYLDAFASARTRIALAHGYFLPDRGIIRAIVAAARRGVEVRLVLSGRSDVPFARAATKSVYRELLAAGVEIHEWTDSVMHAKVATVDGQRLLLGSFNLDPFSLANLEALVTIDDARVAALAETWIAAHFAASTRVTALESSTWARRWILDPAGRLVARLADAMSRTIGRPRRR